MSSCPICRTTIPSRYFACRDCWGRIPWLQKHEIRLHHRKFFTTRTPEDRRAWLARLRELQAAAIAALQPPTQGAPK